MKDFLDNLEVVNNLETKYGIFDDIKKLNDTFKPWKYNFIIYIVFIAMFVVSCCTANNLMEAIGDFLSYCCISAAVNVFGLLVCLCLTRFFNNYKKSKHLYLLLKRLKKCGGLQLYEDETLYEMCVYYLLGPISNCIENILRKKNPNNYQFQIITKIKNNGEILYYPVVKRYNIVNISEYIGNGNDPFLGPGYDTYAEAKKVVDTTKFFLQKEYNIQQAQLEQEKKNRLEIQKRESEAKCKQKQYMLGQKIKQTVIIDC
jgi:hypothetical protein